MRGFTLIELLVVVAVIGVIAAIAIPNLLRALDKSRQKRTMADIRSIGTAVETYSVDNAHYPKANADFLALVTAIEPLYMTKAPRTDGWSQAFQCSVDGAGTTYTVCSPGKNGGTTSCATAAGGATSNFEDAIAFSLGSFTQYPQGVQE